MSRDQYRFNVGTMVLCRTGEDTWSAGEIVQLNYTEERFQGRVMPYQVELDDGRLIYVPLDNVQLCRLLVPPWWEKQVFAGRPRDWFFNNPPADIIRQAYESTHIELRDVNEADHQGETALMRAVQFNWHSGVVELLQLRADVNLVTSQNKHALHFAVPHGENITKQLIDAKADLDCQEDDPEFDPEYTSTTFGDRKSHRTPLHMTTLTCDTDTAQLLLNARADINIPDAQYKTPLHLAIEEKGIEMIEVLLSNRADVNLGNIESGMNNTPLMDAAHTGNLFLAMMLVPARAAINQQGKQGMAALHLAARKGEAKIVQFLLESHGDVNQKSQCGTVEHLARKNGSGELLKILGFVKDGGAADSEALSATNLSAAKRAEFYLD